MRTQCRQDADKMRMSAFFADKCGQMRTHADQNCGHAFSKVQYHNTTPAPPTTTTAAATAAAAAAHRPTAAAAATEPLRRGASQPTARRPSSASAARPSSASAAPLSFLPPHHDHNGKEIEVADNIDKSSSGEVSCAVFCGYVHAKLHQEWYLYLISCLLPSLSL